LYKRVNELENTSNTNNTTNTNKQVVEPIIRQPKDKSIQTYVTDEIKQLFTRMDSIEKKIDEYLVIQQANMDTMQKLDSKLKKMDEGSWYSVDMNNNSISSNNSNKSLSPIRSNLSISSDNLSICSDNLDIQSIDNMDIDVSSDSDPDTDITNKQRK